MSFSQQEQRNFNSKVLQSGVRDADAAKAWFESVYPNSFVLGKNSVWLESERLKALPAANLAAAQANAASNPDLIQDLSAVTSAVRLSPVPTFSGTYVALSTYADFSSQPLVGWVQPQFVPRATAGGAFIEPSNGYSIRLFDGDPNSGGVAIATAFGATGVGLTFSPGWIWDYANGMLLLAGDVTIADPYVMGFRYVGKDALSATTAVTHFYVDQDAVGASDNNDGTQASPFATLDRAIKAIPQKVDHDVFVHVAGSATAYSAAPVRLDLNARVVIICDSGGTEGNGLDSLVSDSVSTSDITSINLNTGGLTPDQYRGKFLVMTSGDANNDRRTIAVNTAVNVKPVSEFTAIPNAGSTLKIAEPAASIEFPDQTEFEWITSSGTAPGIFLSSDNKEDIDGLEEDPGVYFINFTFTKPASATVKVNVKQSRLILIGCLFDGNATGVINVSSDELSSVLMGGDDFSASGTCNLAPVLDGANSTTSWRGWGASFGQASQTGINNVQVINSGNWIGYSTGYGLNLRAKVLFIVKGIDLKADTNLNQAVIVNNPARLVVATDNGSCRFVGYSSDSGTILVDGGFARLKPPTTAGLLVYVENTHTTSGSAIHIKSNGFVRTNGSFVSLQGVNGVTCLGGEFELDGTDPPTFGIAEDAYTVGPSGISDISFFASNEGQGAVHPSTGSRVFTVSPSSFAAAAPNEVETQNLFGWWRAEDDASIVPVTDTNIVSGWIDQSGKGNNLTPPTSLAAPFIVTSVPQLNNKPAIMFSEKIIVCGDGSTIIDGDYVEINDGDNPPVQFTFGGGGISYTAGDSVTVIRDKLVTEINLAGSLDVLARAWSTDKIVLEHTTNNITNKISVSFSGLSSPWANKASTADIDNPRLTKTTAINVGYTDDDDSVTVFVVASLDTGPPLGRFFHVSNAITHGLVMQVSSFSMIDMQRGKEPAIYPITYPWVDKEYRVYHAEVSYGNYQRFYENGIIQATNLAPVKPQLPAVNNITNPNPTRISAGARIIDGKSPARVAIAEIIMYGSAISTDSSKVIYEYLNDRYGFSNTFTPAV